MRSASESASYYFECYSREGDRAIVGGESLAMETQTRERIPSSTISIDPANASSQNYISTIAELRAIIRYQNWDSSMFKRDVVQVERRRDNRVDILVRAAKRV